MHLPRRKTTDNTHVERAVLEHRHIKVLLHVDHASGAGAGRVGRLGKEIVEDRVEPGRGRRGPREADQLFLDEATRVKVERDLRGWRGG